MPVYVEPIDNIEEEDATTFQSFFSLTRTRKDRGKLRYATTIPRVVAEYLGLNNEDLLEVAIRRAPPGASQSLNDRPTPVKGAPNSPENVVQERPKAEAAPAPDTQANSGPESDNTPLKRLCCTSALTEYNRQSRIAVHKGIAIPPNDNRKSALALVVASAKALTTTSVKALTTTDAPNLKATPAFRSPANSTSLPTPSAKALTTNAEALTSAKASTKEISATEYSTTTKEGRQMKGKSPYSGRNLRQHFVKKISQHAHKRIKNDDKSAIAIRKSSRIEERRIKNRERIKKLIKEAVGKKDE